MPGDDWQKFANLRLLFAYMYGHPGKKLLFMGSEFGQWKEWDHAAALDWRFADETDEVGSRHRGVQLLTKDLNRLNRQYSALHGRDFDPSGFAWIDFQDFDNSVIAFQRKAGDTRDSLIFVCNFTPVPRAGYRFGLPLAGRYREVLNTDEVKYGGSGIGNEDPIGAEEVPWHGQPYSAAATLPPLAALVLALD
jgi:1,4-alpha-glucan branching enzyme